jgi:integrase
MIDIFNQPRQRPDRRTRMALKVEDWPLDDQRRWSDAFLKGDVFEAGDGAHLAPSTRTSWENEYGTWLGFLGRSDATVLNEALDARVTRERITEYCSVLAQTNSAYSIAGRVEKLRHALRLLSPETDWEWLLIISKRINARAAPRPKGPRYQDIGNLSILGFKLMEDAQSRTNEEQPLSLNNALAFRDGLVIAVTAATSLRRRNLAQMTIRTHLVRMGSGWRVCFEGSETKNKQPLEMPLPPELSPYIDFYLSSIRGIFAGADQHHAVWASAKGGALKAGAICDLVCARTKAEFGRATNPHMFRDAAATSFSIHSPESVLAAADLLGHKGFRHTQKHYIRAGGVEAARLLAQALRKKTR